MDYYSILGVERSASPDDIKAAYRKLAMKHHPDRGGNADKFKEINEAYDTLGDANKKAQYDHGGANFGNSFRGGPFQQHGFADPFGMGGNPFDDLFQQFGFNFRAGNMRPKNSDLQIKVRISLKDSYMGKTMTINYPLPSGRDQTLEITIPPGVENGQTMKMGGMGDDSVSELARGDLIINLEVDRDPKFRREEMALVTNLEIDIFDAMLGCVRHITNIDDSEIEISIRPGTQNGQKYSCKNLGFRSVKFNNIRGDLIVQVVVKTPVVKDPILVGKIKLLAEEVRRNSI
jgi:curved DNA-binding protein